MRLVQFSSVTLIRLCCKLRILELMPSFIQFYCCCGLCRIFKLLSDFFAVISLKTNSLKMLEKNYATASTISGCTLCILEPSKFLLPKTIVAALTCQRS